MNTVDGFLTEIEQLLREKIGQQIEVVPEGSSFSYVVTPFTMSDGDVYYIALQQLGSDKWLLTDHGHTLMHLSYSMDYDTLREGSRDQVITKALGQFGVQREDDELFVVTDTDNLGNALVDMIQVISRISDVSYLSREQVKSTFWEDFKGFLTSVVPESRVQFKYVNQEFDPRGLYEIDAYVNGTESEPLYIFAIASDSQCQNATVTLYAHERWGLRFRSAAIFRDQTEISRNVLARFSDVVGQQFSSLATSTQERIKQYLSRELKL